MAKSKLPEKVFFTNRNVSSKGQNSRDKKTILIGVKSAKALVHSHEIIVFFCFTTTSYFFFLTFKFIFSHNSLDHSCVVIAVIFACSCERGLGFGWLLLAGLHLLVLLLGVKSNSGCITDLFELHGSAISFGQISEKFSEESRNVIGTFAFVKNIGNLLTKLCVISS